MQLDRGSDFPIPDFPIPRFPDVPIPRSPDLPILPSPRGRGGEERRRGGEEERRTGRVEERRGGKQSFAAQARCSCGGAPLVWDGDETTARVKPQLRRLPRNVGASCSGMGPQHGPHSPSHGVPCQVINYRVANADGSQKRRMAKGRQGPHLRNAKKRRGRTTSPASPGSTPRPKPRPQRPSRRLPLG